MKLIKLFSIIQSACVVSASVSQAFVPSSEQFEIIESKYVTTAHILEDFYFQNQELIDAYNQEISGEDSDALGKRSLTDTLSSLLLKLNSSGVINNALANLASSPLEAAYIAKLLAPVLKTVGGLVNINTIQPVLGLLEQGLNATIASGVVSTTLNTLLYNDENLMTIADFVGDFLRNPNNTWVNLLLVELGQGKQLSLQLINDLILNTKSKANGTTPSNKDQIVKRSKLHQRSIFSFKASNFTGTASTFFDNIFSSLFNVNIISGIGGTVLGALNETNFVSDMVLGLLGDEQAQAGITTLVSAINATGVIDVNLGTYMDALKKSNAISDGLEWALSNPQFAPRLALIFQRMENTGVYYDVQDNLYGPHQRS